MPVDELLMKYEMIIRYQADHTLAVWATEESLWKWPWEIADRKLRRFHGVRLIRSYLFGPPMPTVEVPKAILS